MKLKQELLDSIKKAMQGEKDSVVLYTNAAENTTDKEVKQFFSERAEEEKRHYNYLLQYYTEISNENQLTDFSAEFKSAASYHPTISDEFLKRIGENQVLFSAISTAVLLEKNAIDHYRASINLADSPILQAFYQVMVDWESSHYDECLEIQKNAEAYYWQINQFEPF